MAKVFLICGKICSGKGFYTRQLKEKEHAVVLSCDEIENDLFHHDLGDRRDAISADIKAYLHKKAVDIARAGCNVILDWGFWSRKKSAQMFLPTTKMPTSTSSGTTSTFPMQTGRKTWKRATLPLPPVKRPTTP